MLSDQRFVKQLSEQKYAYCLISNIVLMDEFYQLQLW